MADEPLPEFRVEARNTSANRENRIHDDAVARQYGFRGALVPGVTATPTRVPRAYELAPAVVAEPALRPVPDVLPTAFHRQSAPAP